VQRHASQRDARTEPIELDVLDIEREAELAFQRRLSAGAQSTRALELQQECRAADDRECSDEGRTLQPRPHGNAHDRAT
jgi:hypothetical protein